MSSALDSAPRRPGEFRTGWKPLLGAMAVYAASPVIIAQTASLFIEPVMSQTGLSQTAISIGPIIFITLAVTQPIVAFFINRLGTRPLGLTAVGVMLGGLVLLTILPPSRFSFYGVGILMGLGGALGYLATTAQFLSKWFSKHYGLTVGIVGAVGGIVPLLLTPILGVVLENSGWRTGYYMIGAFMLIICLPLVVAFFREPKVPVAAPSGAAPTATADSDKPQAQALEGIPRVRPPRIPATGFSPSPSSGEIAVGGFLASIVPILIGKGYDPSIAAIISMAMLAGVMTGRIVGGKCLLDRSPFPYLVPVVLFALSGISAVADAFPPPATPPSSWCSPPSS